MESKPNIAEGSNAKDNAQKASNKPKSAEKFKILLEVLDMLHENVLRIEKCIDEGSYFFVETDLEGIHGALKSGVLPGSKMQMKDFARVVAKIEKLDKEQLTPEVDLDEEMMMEIAEQNEKFQQAFLKLMML